MQEHDAASAAFDRLPAGSRVVVAMSGGVDSSVAAALAAAHGLDVVGVTLQLYDHGQATGRAGACCAGQDIHDARRVAELLAIPHYVLDFEARFKEAVIDDFAASYAEGRTPIPCVRCNQRVKFRDLMDIARDLGAAALVTGHYARRLDRDQGAELHRAVEDARDQSYFLFATTPAQLDFLRLPLGGLPKDETRRIAGRLGLAVAEKPDSQDICFVPSGRYDRIVGRLRPDAMTPGEIVDGDGRVLGRHGGIARFTVGQRRGVGVAGAERMYVTEIDAPRRRVVVGPREVGRRTGAELDEVNWLDGAIPATGLPVLARHRARQPLVPATVRPAAGGGASVTFDQPQAGVAPGQACVLYDGSRLLGGGWMRATAP